MQRIGWMVVVAGLGVAAIGLLLVVGSHLGLGRLPGDIAYRGKNVRVFVPLASSIVISIVLTVVLNLIFRR